MARRTSGKAPARRRTSAVPSARAGGSEPGETARSRKRASAPYSYTEQQKLDAVVAMMYAGQEHALSQDALDAARAVLQAPVATGTLARWLTKYHDAARAVVPMPVASVAQAQQAAIDGKQAVVTGWAAVERKALERLGTAGVMEAAAARDVAVVGGIARTHLNKLSGVRPELEVKMMQYEALCARANLDPVQALDDIMAVIEARLPRLANVVPELGAARALDSGDKADG